MREVRPKRSQAQSQCSDTKDSELVRLAKEEGELEDTRDGDRPSPFTLYEEAIAEDHAASRQSLIKMEENCERLQRRLTAIELESANLKRLLRDEQIKTKAVAKRFYEYVTTARHQLKKKSTQIEHLESRLTSSFVIECPLCRHSFNSTDFRPKPPRTVHVVPATNTLEVTFRSYKQLTDWVCKCGLVLDHNGLPTISEKLIEQLNDVAASKNLTLANTDSALLTELPPPPPPKPVNSLSKHTERADDRQRTSKPAESSTSVKRASTTAIKIDSSKNRKRTRSPASSSTDGVARAKGPTDTTSTHRQRRGRDRDVWTESRSRSPHSRSSSRHREGHDCKRRLSASKSNQSPLPRVALESHASKSRVRSDSSRHAVKERSPRKNDSRRAASNANSTPLDKQRPSSSRSAPKVDETPLVKLPPAKDSDQRLSDSAVKSKPHVTKPNVPEKPVRHSTVSSTEVRTQPGMSASRILRLVLAIRVPLSPLRPLIQPTSSVESRLTISPVFDDCRIPAAGVPDSTDDEMCEEVPDITTETTDEKVETTPIDRLQSPPRRVTPSRSAPAAAAPFRSPLSASPRNCRPQLLTSVVSATSPLKLRIRPSPTPPPPPRSGKLTAMACFSMDTTLQLSSGSEDDDEPMPHQNEAEIDTAPTTTTVSDCPERPTSPTPIRNMWLASISKHCS